MTTFLALATLTAAATFAVPVLLLHLPLTRAPGLGVVVWAAAVTGASAGALATAVAAAGPLLRHAGGPAELVHRCSTMAAALGGHLLLVVAATTGIGAAIGVLLVGSRSLTRQLREFRDHAVQHQILLAALGQPGQRIAVIPDRRPAAWSLSANRGYIAVTTGAADSLTRAELGAVLAHEHAHLRRHHHLILTAFRTARAMLPCPLTRTAARSVADLLEMHADDAAAATHGRAATAHALLHLAAGPVGSGLAMGGAHPPLAAQRVSRLLQPKPPLRLHRLQLVATSLATLFVPTGFGIALTSATLRLHFCPPPT